MKFVWNPGDNRDELYDLKNDPIEVNNLIKDKKYTKQLRHMVQLMEDELVRIKDPSIEKFRYQVAGYRSKEGTSQAYNVD